MGRPKEGTRVPPKKFVRGVHVDPVKEQVARDMTAEETILWQPLKGNRLEGLHSRRQQAIKGFIGRLLLP